MSGGWTGMREISRMDRAGDNSEDNSEDNHALSSKQMTAAFKNLDCLIAL